MAPQAEDIVERMGQKFEADGLPRTAGRLIGHLLLSPEPRTLDELSDSLLVSRTSANTNARLLERIGVVSRVTRPGDRRDYYRISEDLHLRLIKLRKEQLRTTRDLLAEARGSVELGSAAVRTRLATFEDFFADMLAVVEEAEARWKPAVRP